MQEEHGAPGTASDHPATDNPGTFTYTVSGGPTCADAQASITVSETMAMNAGADSTITLCGNGTPVDLSTLLNGADAGGDWSNGSGQYGSGQRRSRNGDVHR